MEVAANSHTNPLSTLIRILLRGPGLGLQVENSMDLDMDMGPVEPQTVDFECTAAATNRGWLDSAL